jgi:hypothetical protein
LGTQEAASASREEIERLALIRYQLDLALRQAEQAHPRNGFCVLGFQDAVEWFFYLAADHLDVEPKKKDFSGYYKEISANMPDEIPLGYEAALMSLNNARVNLKHYGNLPDQSTIERHRGTVQAFFDEATPRLFDASFASISLVHLMQDEKVNQNLKSAEDAWQTGDARMAMGQLRLGFNHSLDEHLGAC